MVTRFAPAPTGHLHLGHVVNALYVWGAAHDRDGRVLLRIEDHDRQRSRPEYEASIVEDLAWLGFRHDGPIVRQSERDAVYRTALQPLIDRELVFGCTCSRADIQSDVYPGTCRDRDIPLEDGVGWRVRMDPGVETFDDLQLGRQVQEPYAQCGDLLVRDRDGNWTYQFAVTVDDLTVTRASVRPTRVAAHIASLKWTRPEYAAALTRAHGGDIDYTRRPSEDFASLNMEFETDDGRTVIGEATTSWSYVGPGLRLSAELLGAPVLDQFGRFNFPVEHPLNLTGQADKVIPQADLILALDVPDLEGATVRRVQERGNRRAAPLMAANTKIINVALDDLLVRAWATDRLRSRTGRAPY